MKIAFTVFLVLTTLAETLAAVTLIGGPAGISAAGQIEGGMWAMNYGFAVICIASAVLWVWPHRSNPAAVTPVLGILMTFHICLCFALSLDDSQRAGQIIHGVLAVLGVFLFTQRHKWCDN